ncbi:MAG TPA: ABC transporter permease [Verrucomicrobiota bacterium]|nr:hypothetical protein [Verrucomicrobiales bacterium]HRI14818.1 ABC transporter permease [Verrucomicrobiota bacterium]
MTALQIVPAVLRDFRTGVRLLLRQPGFTFVAVLALALGLGATTAAFSVFNGVLLRPLPLVPREQDLLSVTQVQRGGAGGPLGCSVINAQEIRRRAKHLEGLVLADRRTFILTDPGKPPERLLGSWLSGDTFKVLGVKPILGEDFSPQQQAPGQPEVVLLGYEVWQRRYGGLPGIIGQLIEISGRPAQVVGVMPPGWRFPAAADIWMPWQPEPGKDAFYYGHAFARIRSGSSLAEVQAELGGIAADLAREHPATAAELGIVAEPLREKLSAERRPLVVLALGAVLLVQLIACTNVASLLLARGARRMKEVAVRLALGATRWEVIRQLLIESLLLGLVGGALGLLLAAWAVDALRVSPGVWLPFWLRFDLDGRVIAFAIAAAVVSSLLAGLLPAVMLTRPGLAEELKEGGRSSGPGESHQRLRHSLVVAQVALALVLLVGAGLTLRSLWKLRTEKLGFDPRQVFTFRVGLPQSHYTNPAVVREFFTRLETNLAQLPGVQSVGTLSILPGTPEREVTGFSVVGASTNASQAKLHAVPVMVSPGALPALRVALIEGRNLTAGESGAKKGEAVVDREFVRRYFPTGHTLGTKLRFAKDETETNAVELTIVGVVEDVRFEFGKAEPLPIIYGASGLVPANFLSVVMRVEGNPDDYAKVAQRTVFLINPPLLRPGSTNATVEPTVPIYQAHSLRDVLTHATWDRQVLAVGFVLYAALALFLSVLGIYGMIAYSVSQRTQEIGVRMALGAQRQEVVRMVVRAGGRLLAVGLVLGLLFAGLLTPLLGDVLQAAAVSPWDPPVFGLVPLVLGLAGLLAAWIPARRATRIPPLTALRTE